MYEAMKTIRYTTKMAHKYLALIINRLKLPACESDTIASVPSLKELLVRLSTSKRLLVSNHTLAQTGMDAWEHA